MKNNLEIEINYVQYRNKQNNIQDTLTDLKEFTSYIDENIKIFLSVLNTTNNFCKEPFNNNILNDFNFELIEYT